MRRRKLLLWGIGKVVCVCVCVEGVHVRCEQDCGL